MSLVPTLFPINRYLNRRHVVRFPARANVQLRPISAGSHRIIIDNIFFLLFRLFHTVTLFRPLFMVSIELDVSNR